jgi:hypothetical protein
MSRSTGTGVSSGGQSIDSRSPASRLETRRGAAGFDPRKIQQRVDEMHQPNSTAMRHFGKLALLGGGVLRTREQLLERTEQQGERRAKFMGDVGEKFGFGAVRVLQLLVCARQLLRSLFELPVGVLQRHIGLHHLGAHAVRPRADMLDSRFARLLVPLMSENKFGHVLDTVKDEFKLAIRAYDRCVQGAPISHLIALGTVAQGNVIFLHAHRIRHAIPHDPIQRRPQIAFAACAGIARIFGEHFEQAAADDR